MSWNKLAPIAKSTGRPMVSASIVVAKSGDAKIHIVLSSSIHDEFGKRLKVDVSAGEGVDTGSLLIEFDPAGAFEVKLFTKGGGRLFVPVPEGVPRGAGSNQACILGARSNDSLVIKLPVETWSREISARRPAAAASGGGQDLTPAPKPALNGQVLDMVEYLSGKGVKISRLAEGRFALEGETVTAGAVLKMVNDRRTKAGLDPLPAAKVR